MEICSSIISGTDACEQYYIFTYLIRRPGYAMAKGPGEAITATVWQHSLPLVSTD